MKNLDSICVSPEASLRQVMELINQNAIGIALVTDQERHLLDTVTDGDIRRALLEGLDLGTPVARLSLRRDAGAKPHIAPVGTSRKKLFELMTRAKIQQLPLLD